MKKLILMLILILSASFCYAETECWILCQPDSYVNVRPNSNKKGQAEGYLLCGDKAATENATRNGYLFLTQVSTERGEGWVNSGYVVYSKPVYLNKKVNICSKGRVACRRAIGGSRRCWAKDGDTVTVYYISDEWSITNKGFIKTEYLGVSYDVCSRFLASGSHNGEPEGLYFEDDER